MSSVDSLREFVNERLTAAAEEIFVVFKQTVVKYEEEIDRQRRLLDNVWKSGMKYQGTEHQQQHVCKEEEEEEVLADQPLCKLERIFSLDPENPQLPQIKDKQDKLCTSQEGEQLVLKLESDAFILTPSQDKSDHSETEPNRDNPLNSDDFHVVESQDPKEGKDEDSESTPSIEPDPKEGYHKSHSHNVFSLNTSDIHFNPKRDKKSFICDTCGKGFKSKSHLTQHMSVHTGEKPYSCHFCGKDFRVGSNFKVHIRTHTGEKPYVCKTCKKGFCDVSGLKRHMRTHTGEKPYTCKACGKAFGDISALKTHIRIHTGERPYNCKTCGKTFRDSRAFRCHMIFHIDEKQFTC